MQSICFISFLFSVLFNIEEINSKHYLIKVNNNKHFGNEEQTGKGSESEVESGVKHFKNIVLQDYQLSQGQN